MAYHQAPLVKHHHITVKESVPFGDTSVPVQLVKTLWLR
jgi:hypothetical protein